MVSSEPGGGPLSCELDPWCQRVLMKQWPRVRLYDDVKELIRRAERGEVERVDVLSGGFPCFAAGTLVQTYEGWVPIEDIQVGDQGLTHQGRWRAVTDTMSREVDSTVEVRAQGMLCGWNGLGPVHLPARRR